MKQLQYNKLLTTCPNEHPCIFVFQISIQLSNSTSVFPDHRSGRTTNSNTALTNMPPTQLLKSPSGFVHVGSGCSAPASSVLIALLYFDLLQVECPAQTKGRSRVRWTLSATNFGCDIHIPKGFLDGFVA